MDIYHIFADHHKDVDGYEFAGKMRKFLDGMVALGNMQSYRLTRAKLGFRSMDLPEFHIMMEFKNMQQLDDAMTSVLRNEKHMLILINLLTVRLFNIFFTETFRTISAIKI